MDSNDELKEIDIKKCDVIIKIKDFNHDNILRNKKSYENILVFKISCKTLIDAKPLRTTFDKIDGFVRVYNGTRYSVLFESEKYCLIYYRIR